MIQSLQAEIFNGNSEISNVDLFPYIYIEDDAVRSKQELCNVLQKDENITKHFNVCVVHQPTYSLSGCFQSKLL